MRRAIVLMLSAALLVALAVPVAAVAKSGNGNSNHSGAGAGTSHSNAQRGRSAGKADRSVAKVRAKVQRNVRKTQQASEKAIRKEEHQASKAAREASRSAAPREDRDEIGDSEESSASVEGTRAVGPGVTRAFSRITANIEKSVAKVEAGKKKQLPPGLMRVWLKFAGWLGVDPSTIPRVREQVPTSTVDPTSTVEPTMTPVP